MLYVLPACLDLGSENGIQPVKILSDGDWTGASHVFQFQLATLPLLSSAVAAEYRLASHFCYRLAGVLLEYRPFKERCLLSDLM